MNTGAGGAQAHLARPRWAERTFVFVHPPWMLADFLERLRGTVPRLGPLLHGVNHELAHRRVNGTWSIAQNVGHLSDVEDLWQERLDDLRRGRERYTPADPARLQAAAERHEGKALASIVEELDTRRRALVAAMESAPPALHMASAFHERLQCPMRLVDCAQFYTEHDDHHLLRIRALRTTFGLA